MSAYKFITESDATFFTEYCHDNFSSLSSSQINLLLSYLDLLLEKNQHVNLTAIKESQKGVVLHLIDSLLFLKLLPKGIENLLDIGSGGGLPGIPLGIATGMHITSLDSVKKKIEAQKEFVEQLKLSNFSFSTERIEALPKTYLAYFDIVTARALASLPVLVEYATPLLKQEGYLLVSKGQMEPEERTSGEKAAEICGLTLVKNEYFTLPYGMGTRELLLYKMTRDSKVKLPRAVGKAVKAPLA